MDTEPSNLYDRKRLMSIFNRLTKAGGVPLDNSKTYQFACWFRTLVARDCVEEAHWVQGDEAKLSFKEKFPNPATRTHYTRAMLVYIQALTDKEYAAEYPNIARIDLVSRINDITRAAGLERRAKKNDR